MLQFDILAYKQLFNHISCNSNAFVEVKYTQYVVQNKLLVQPYLGWCVLTINLVRERQFQF